MSWPPRQKKCITSMLLVVADEQEVADEITARLRALRANGPVCPSMRDTGPGGN